MSVFLSRTITISHYEVAWFLMSEPKAFDDDLLNHLAKRIQRYGVTKFEPPGRDLGYIAPDPIDDDHEWKFKLAVDFVRDKAPEVAIGPIQLLLKWQLSEEMAKTLYQAVLFEAIEDGRSVYITKKVYLDFCIEELLRCGTEKVEEYCLAGYGELLPARSVQRSWKDFRKRELAQISD